MCLIVLKQDQYYQKQVAYNVIGAPPYMGISGVGLL